MDSNRGVGIAGGEAMDIAVVGIGCRFPGGASSPEKLWDMVAQKRSARREIPSERFNIDAFYHPNADKNGTVRDPVLSTPHDTLYSLTYSR